MDNTESKLNTFTSNAANQSSEANQAAFNEVNKGVISSAEKMKEELAGLKSSSDEINRFAHERIEESISASKTATTQTLLFASRAILLFNWVSNFGLLILIIKSFSYVFSRVAFTEANSLYVDIKDKAKDFKNGEIIQAGTEYSIPVNNTETLFLSRRYLPTGRAPKVAIPQWTTGIIGRLRAKVYIMNEIQVRPEEKETVDFRSMAGAEFVEWNLAENEQVVFSYEDLVAIGERVKLISHISFKITSLFFGRTIFRIAKGPGKLVLRTLGKPITHQTPHLVKSVPIERIKAWQRTTRFSIDSEVNTVDMFFSGLYLKRKNDDLIIIDADTGNAKRKVGLARFIRRFFLPF